MQCSTKCSALSRIPWQKVMKIMFISFFKILIYYFIFFATDVFKDFAIHFYVDGFSLVTSVFTLENFEEVRIFFGYSFAAFFPRRSNHWRFFPLCLVKLLILHHEILIPCTLQQF